jgi:hypothetical protein
MRILGAQGVGVGGVSDSASFSDILNELARKNSREETLVNEKGPEPKLDTCRRGVKWASGTGNFFYYG